MLPGAAKPQNKTNQNKLKFSLFTLKNIITVMSIWLSCEQTCLRGKDNITYFLFLFPCVFSSVSVINIIKYRFLLDVSQRSLTSILQRQTSELLLDNKLIAPRWMGCGTFSSVIAAFPHTLLITYRELLVMHASQGSTENTFFYSQICTGYCHS